MRAKKDKTAKPIVSKITNKQKIGKQKDKKMEEQTAENIIQNLNKTNKTLKRKANESDSPKQVFNKKQKVDEKRTKGYRRQDNRRTLYVTNVSVHTTEKDLEKFFSSYGEVDTIRFNKNFPFTKRQSIRKTMIAYVAFKTEQDAVKAKNADGQFFNNFHLKVVGLNEKVANDNKKKIILPNVPFAAEEKDVRKVFEDCGKVLRVKLVRDKKTRKAKCIGYVYFAHMSAVNLALQLGIVQINNREVKIFPCSTDDKRKLIKERKEREIVVINIPEDTAESDIHDTFGKCGRILSSRIVFKDDLCYVCFETDEAVENAVKMQNPKLNGEPVTIQTRTNKQGERDPSIYIGNLPLTTTNQEIFEIFKDCGVITSMKLLCKKHKPFGAGFVNFKDEEAIEKAIIKKVKIGNNEMLITRRVEKSKLIDSPEYLANKKIIKNASSADDEEDDENGVESDEDEENGVENDDDEENDAENDDDEENDAESDDDEENGADSDDDEENGAESDDDEENDAESDDDEEEQTELGNILTEAIEDSDDNDEDDDDDDDEDEEIEPPKVSPKKFTPKKFTPKKVTPKKVK